MNVRHLVAAATVAVSAFALSGAASAATAEFGAEFLWSGLSATTPLSAPAAETTFNFDISSVIPASGVVAGSAVSDFSYKINNVTQNLTVSSITFVGGVSPGFDISFTDGKSFDFVSSLAPLVVSNLVQPGAYIGNATTTGAASTGFVGVAVSAVPLPAALPLFGAAFAGLAGLAGRKSNRSIAA